jgi:SAM-dependent methyltransferase
LARWPRFRGQPDGGDDAAVTTNRWTSGNVPRGDEYDRRFDDLAASGHDVHGEADLVDGFGPGSVLDAGCGTGRLAIELARRGHRVVGVDSDPAMLEVARRKAPALRWLEGDLANPALATGEQFDVVVLAGNVLIFVAPGTEATVIANMALRLGSGGRLVAGYSLRSGRLTLAAHDQAAAQSGLLLEHRWSTWHRDPFTEGDDYAVSIHRRPQ